MRLSKSRYLAGLQCKKQLWYLVNKPEKVPAPDAHTKRMFDQGHRIGELAKQQYPRGYEIPYGPLASTVKRTRDVLSGAIPLFEASFSREDAYCRVDILVPREGEWDIVEVKSGTRVKEVNLEDIAFQKWVCSSTIRIGRCYLLHVDRDYIRDGPIDPERILAIEDVTERVAELEPLIPARVSEMIAVIDGPEPAVLIGTQCTSPHTCPLMDHCWKDVPQESVLNLYRMRKEDAFAHYHAGRRFSDLDPSELSEKQRIQHHAHVHNERHVDHTRIGRWLEGLAETIVCLDFETASSAIPLTDGMRPYEQIPFQYSAHIINERVEHIELLSESLDPRREIAEGLLALPEATLLAHNASFEKRIIASLAESFPDLREGLLALNERMQDLMTPFSAFWFYDPNQHGSCSMKAILPALGIADYATLAIGSGDVAAMEWERLVLGDIDEHEKERIRSNLIEYCRLDTWGMVEILNRIRAAIVK